ncbi:DinB family protein [Zavarzinia aquatilis]|uniref:Damage-inducible protein DinB n=1 Tax=Zavarzinia aquatilis TaxID=2211142 RepID=A0A317E717_9PROT|nr:DinB family protein [Zavarzinia aquatilis]PWR22908.1 damage-inducible protein DinB [Zavarzinia aquatilis]
MKAHFQDFAAYNDWANRRLYEAVGALPAEDFTRDLKAFFGSIRGTLNHILVADLIWLGRFTGKPAAGITSLDQTLHEDFAALDAARREVDRRLIDLVDGMASADFAATIAYRTMTRGDAENRVSDMLTHVFNHQTHHRGQAHGLLSLLGREAPSLDLILFLNTR